MAYLAGFLDGDGSITIMRSASRNPGNLVPQVSFYNTNKEVMEWISNLVHRRMYSQRWRRRQPNEVIKKSYQPKEMWTITAGGRKAVALAKLMRPYLKIKKARADAIIEFQENPLTAPMEPKNFYLKLPEETRKAREAIHAHMHLLP